MNQLHEYFQARDFTNKATYAASWFVSFSQYDIPQPTNGIEVKMIYWRQLLIKERYVTTVTMATGHSYYKLINGKT